MSGIGKYNCRSRNLIIDAGHRVVPEALKEPESRVRPARLQFFLSIPDSVLRQSREVLGIHDGTRVDGMLFSLVRAVLLSAHVIHSVTALENGYHRFISEAVVIAAHERALRVSVVIIFESIRFVSR